MLMFCCTHSGLYRKTELVTPDFSSETMKARSQRYIFKKRKRRQGQGHIEALGGHRRRQPTRQGERPREKRRQPHATADLQPPER